MKTILVTVAICLLQLVSYGQNTLRPSLYFQNMNYYNPSAVDLGSTESGSVSVYGKHKFVDNQSDIWAKPTTFYLNHIGRIQSSNSFYSVSYLNDSYSFYNRSTLYLGYTYQTKWGRLGTLSFGSRIIGNVDAIQWDKLKIPHQETGKSLKASPDLNVGIQYQWKGLTAGISAKNLLRIPTKIEGSILLQSNREVYIHTSYLFKLGRHFQVAPFVLLYQEHNRVLDGGLYVSFLNRVSVSYLLRLEELRGIYSIDGNLSKRLRVGIAIDRSRLFTDNNVDVQAKYSF